VKILGIDPGSNTTGFGVIIADRLKFTYIASGCIKTKGSLTDKITTIFNSVHEIITQHQPDIVVIERAFMRPDRPNPDAAIKLGHARGAIISAAGMSNIAMVEYSPNQIKKTLTGKGHADKKQVSFMVCETLKLSTAPQSDAADALAGAICHGYHLL
jgi:crossover junction endodeoxyribonuclease RuvC